jgi:hypothetical protein
LELGVFEVNGSSGLNRAGKAKTEHGEVHLYCDANNAEPVVHCPATGKRFRLRWQDIIEIALNQGLTIPNNGRH